MNADARVLHLVCARGGGMTRFARDLIAGGAGHGLLHVDADCVVLELPPADNLASEPRFLPYRWPADEHASGLQALLDSHGFDLLQVHWIAPETLPMLQAWSELGRSWLASLHDVGFLHPGAFNGSAALPEPDPDWIACWHTILARASAITVPSAFLAHEFADAYPDLHCQVVAPGVDRPALAEAAHSGLQTIAIVGAIGEHKGKQRLLRWLAHPESARFRWVLLGYTDDQLQPGWLEPGHMWVHGPFAFEQTGHWLRHYRVDLVLFPNRLAESFSYALSDVWAAGVPVLVPDCGALGERVGQHGGGAVIADPDAADALIEQLQALQQSPEQLRRWREQIDMGGVAMIPDKAAMVAATRALQVAVRPAQAGDHASAAQRLQSYLLSQLSDVVFRHENIRLARDYAQVREWADKLERDVEGMRADLKSEQEARQQIEDALQAREKSVVALRVRNRQVEAHAADLKERNTQVEAVSSIQAQQLQQLQSQQAQLQAQCTELRSAREHLIEQLAASQTELRVLADTCQQQAGEITVMRQHINALEHEIAPLRIKGARYDRVRSWLPPIGLRWLRRCLALRRRNLNASALR